MNIRNPKKRVPTAKSIQNKNIPDLSAEPLAGSNSIPKQHVGTEQTNQLEFGSGVGRIFSPISKQTYTNQIDFKVIPTAYFCLDENPFDLLPEDLFDISLSEDDELNQPETSEEPVNESNEEVSRATPEKVYQSNENNPGFEKNQEDEYEESSSQNESSTSVQQSKKIKPIVNHPLKPIVEKWLKQVPKSILPNYKSIINKFIKFLADKKIQAPNTDHITLYHITLKNNPKISDPSSYVTVVRGFFKWTAEAGYYENITIGTENEFRTKKRRRKNKNHDNGQEVPKPKLFITMHDMETAKFFPYKAEYLINSDLVVFKRWIENLDSSFTNIQKKGYILKFAYFLYSENRTIPTQQDIIDYYKKNLAHFCIDTVNKNMISIRNFFEWTAEYSIYPDIAINIYATKRKPITADDIPILPSVQEMKDIPNPTRPLINKTV